MAICIMFPLVNYTDADILGLATFIVNRVQMDIVKSARLAPISLSVIGGMLTSKCAITQVANKHLIFRGSLFAFSGHRNLNLTCQKRIDCGGFTNVISHHQNDSTVSENLA